MSTAGKASVARAAKSIGRTQRAHARASRPPVRHGGWSLGMGDPWPSSIGGYPRRPTAARFALPAASPGCKAPGRRPAPGCGLGR